MTSYASKPIRTAMVFASLAALAGCAGMAGSVPAGQTLYRCDQGLQFSVGFVNDTAVIKGARGDDVLLRDAGGQGAQTVFSNSRLRAEFGMGASGREAALQYLQPLLVAHCMRD